MVNFNCPGQIVAAGTAKGIASLAKKVQGTAGAKAIPLAVSGPFHSSLLAQAAKEMEEKLAPAALKDAKIDVYSNCDARPERSAEQIRKNLVTQIDHAVLWEDSIRAMIAKGIETFIEIGPGKVLSGLLRKTDRKIRALNIEDPESLNKTLEILKFTEVSVK
jgi:[acyl-carrier-protein] S-malonyltransferase